MEWIQLLAIVGSNIGMCLWLRTETRNDYIELKSLIDEIHSEIHQEIKAIRFCLYKIKQESKKIT
jgi:hypothetical protein